MLIGTWDYRHLTPVPAAMHSLHRMQSLLTSSLCGSWPQEKILVADNRTKPGDLHHELVLWLREAVDVAFFYYVGHGQYDNDDRLCLALGDSSPDPVLRTTTSLTFDAVRLAFRSSKATTKIAVLDCCFAGLAADQHGRLSGSHDIPRSPGFYLMMASGEFNTAWFETLEENPRPETYFTKYLVDVIESGIPDHPAGLTLGPIFDRVSDALTRDGKPVPGCRVSDHAASFIFARNRVKGDPKRTGGSFPSSPVSALTEGDSASIGISGKPAQAVMGPDEMYSSAYALESDWDGAGLEDFAEMEKLYRAAANLGQTDAMGRLGLILEGKTRSRLEGGNRSYESPDIDEAMYWYRKSAERGNIYGAYWLGLLYEDHLGDVAEALKWYETAARAGHRGAQEARDGLRERLALGLGPLARARPFQKNSVHQPPAQPKNRKVTMASKRADAQGDIISKISKRTATPSDVERLRANHERWKIEWKGEIRANAALVNELARACGDSRGEWGTLAEQEQAALAYYFGLAFLPTRDSIEEDAHEFRGLIRNAGSPLRDFAQMAIRFLGWS
ncbi:caspase family protein [Streptomyces niveus]|uniref:caspase, EACC1-associated type n=1 Tax=Streptomyces niveus TaxID=193462 RepID=UPI0036D2EFE9